jgi:murein DD-endopeptidase MepM/ murein hydrolase activator NlpD
MKTLAAFLLAGLLCIAGLPARAAGPAEVSFEGRLEPGALVIGRTAPGSRVTLDGVPLMVSANGLFALGFDRDHGPAARLVVTSAQGRSQTHALRLAPRDYAVQRIEGVAPKYVTPPPEALARIRKEAAEKAAARPSGTDAEWFAQKFIWPAHGRISGVFGSQRIYNGEPRRPHYGVDVAAPEGAPVVAPADGIVRLAEPGMYFEGGLVFIDHGQGVISQLMHLSRVDVKAGERVRQGERIGAVGKTGRATGPHLHWGMVWREAHVDPALRVAGGEARAVPGVTVGDNAAGGD